MYIKKFSNVLQHCVIMNYENIKFGDLFDRVLLDAIKANDMKKSGKDFQDLDINDLRAFGLCDSNSKLCQRRNS